ncbi:hypothetical protein DITRI_Ditri18aG0063100 [Diplodiscus trichospermus]
MTRVRKVISTLYKNGFYVSWHQLLGLTSSKVGIALGVLASRRKWLNAVLVITKNAGHSMHVENPKELHKHLTHFFC